MEEEEFKQVNDEKQQESAQKEKGQQTRNISLSNPTVENVLNYGIKGDLDKYVSANNDLCVPKQEEEKIHSLNQIASPGYANTISPSEKIKAALKKSSSLEAVIMNAGGQILQGLRTTPNSKRNSSHNGLQGQQRHRKYDGQAIPPDFNLAEEHRLATSVGMEKAIKDLKENEDIGYCSCCARQIQRIPLKLGCNIYELSFLGSGYPLYFQFMKQCIELLVLVLIFSGIFNGITNILQSSSCTQESTSLSSSGQSQSSNSSSTSSSQSSLAVCNNSNWMGVLSLGSKSDQQTFMEIQGYLNLASLIAMMFLLQFFRKLQRELDSKCDTEDISANDYTVIVKNIPKDIDAVNDDYDDDLKEFMESHALENQDVQIESVTLCYDLSELEKLEKQKEKLVDKKKKCKERQNIIRDRIVELKQEMKKVCQVDSNRDNNKQQGQEQQQRIIELEGNQMSQQNRLCQEINTKKVNSGNNEQAISSNMQFSKYKLSLDEQNIPLETEQEQIEENSEKGNQDQQNNHQDNIMVINSNNDPTSEKNDSDKDNIDLMKQQSLPSGTLGELEPTSPQGILNEGMAQLMPVFGSAYFVRHLSSEINELGNNNRNKQNMSVSRDNYYHNTLQTQGSEQGDSNVLCFRKNSLQGEQQSYLNNQINTNKSISQMVFMKTQVNQSPTGIGRNHGRIKNLMLNVPRNTRAIRKNISKNNNKSNDNNNNTNNGNEGKEKTQQVKLESSNSQRRLDRNSCLSNNISSFEKDSPSDPTTAILKKQLSQQKEQKSQFQFTNLNQNIISNNNNNNTFLNGNFTNNGNNIFQNTFNIHNNNMISLSTNQNDRNILNINNNQLAPQSITININNNFNINGLVFTTTTSSAGAAGGNTNSNQHPILQSKEIQNILKTQQKQQALYDSLSKQLQESQQSSTHVLDKITVIEKQLSAIDKQTKELTVKLMDGKGKDFMKRYFTGIAFVCFKREQDKEEIIDRYRPIGWDDRLVSKMHLKQHVLMYHNEKLDVQQAPDPTDMNWMNLHFTKNEKQRRRWWSFMFTTAALLVCAGLIYAFHLLQKSQESSDTDSSTSFKTQLLSSVMAVFISFLNIVLSLILKMASYNCKYSTRTETNIFIAKGLSIARFVNSALINFVIQLFVSSAKDKQTALFGSGGLGDNANYFMISNCFVTAFAQLINVEYYLIAVLRRIEQQRGSNSVLTQNELNELFENPQFHIEERYAQLLMTMFTTAFYCPIVPMVIVWSLIGIFLQYWVDKYNLIYRSSVKYNMSATLSIEMTEHLEYFLPIQSLSTLIFYQYANGGDWALSSIVGTCLGWLHAFLPMQLINERFFTVEKAEANTLEYQEAQNCFITDYNRENPIYKQQARESHVKRMNVQVSMQKTYLQGFKKVVNQTISLNKISKALKSNSKVTSPEESIRELKTKSHEKVGLQGDTMVTEEKMEKRHLFFGKTCKDKIILKREGFQQDWRNYLMIIVVFNLGYLVITQETFVTNEEDGLQMQRSNGYFKRKSFLKSQLQTSDTNQGIVNDEQIIIGENNNNNNYTKIDIENNQKELGQILSMNVSQNRNIKNIVGQLERINDDENEECDEGLKKQQLLQTDQWRKLKVENSKPFKKEEDIDSVEVIPETDKQRKGELEMEEENDRSQEEDKQGIKNNQKNNQ